MLQNRGFLEIERCDYERSRKNCGWFQVSRNAACSSPALIFLRSNLARLRFFSKFGRSDGDVAIMTSFVFEPGPPAEVFATVPVAKEHLATITRGLVGVVSEQGGTGGRARVAGIAVAGKTGTAQVVNLDKTEALEDDEIPIKFRDHGWFVAFAPAEAPEVVVVALVEHGGHGGSAAGPIVNAVLSRYFETQRDEGPPQPAELGDPGERVVRN